MKKITVSRSKSSVREGTAAYAFGVSNERGEKLDKILDKIDELEFYKYMILFVEDTTYLDGIDLLKRWWDAGRANNYKEFLDVYEPDEDTFVYPWEAEKKPFEDAGIEYGGELDQGLPLERIYQKYIAMMNDGNLSFWKFVTELEPFDFDEFLDEILKKLGETTINENTKITLTIGQLKRLVKESLNEKDSEGMMMWNSNDEEISVEEFVDKVHRVEQDLEDMIIQNAEVYANADDPWMLFCDDITDEDHDTEEALGLDFYAYSTAKDKLPKDISKYICFQSSGKGSGFFDAVEFTHDIFTRVMSVCKDLDESVHESRLNWKGPKVLKRKWDGYTGMVTFRLGKISDEEYYRNPARRCPVDITIETSMGHFSAMGEIGNANGTNFNRAGQIIEDIADHNGYIYKQLPKLSQVMVDKIAGWWKQYHLVDLDDIPEEDYDAISQMIEYAKDYEV